MTKYEIARWLTPGLAHFRLVFTPYGGSTHGVIEVEHEQENGDWETYTEVTKSNGKPRTEWKEIDNTSINQFTGDKS